MVDAARDGDSKSVFTRWDVFIDHEQKVGRISLVRQIFWRSRGGSIRLRCNVSVKVVCYRNYPDIEPRKYTINRE